MEIRQSSETSHRQWWRQKTTGISDAMQIEPDIEDAPLRVSELGDFSTRPQVQAGLNEAFGTTTATRNIIFVEENQNEYLCK
ncbi:hypothetical protein NKH73_16170 [Mesorhizobium sp. M0938]|uniref:hypothetical protein n=1 Tax=unclassified Mesorhizobium TaxID=325217 RepID=UPI00333838B9